jgi:LacI family transcriptional regulator
MASTPKKHSSRAATLADVGREAGVSAMAASSVLNRTKNSSRISQETKERILRAARKLNYRPNGAARALQNRRMNTIGVSVVLDHNELNPYFLEVFNGIVEAADRLEQNTTVFTLNSWENDLDKLIGFCDGRIDGMIMVGPLVTPSFDRIVPHHTPFVSLHSNSILKNVINIESNEGTGSYDMVKHLISLGHKRILFVSGPESLTGIQRRLQGYENALQESGIEVREELITYTDLNIRGGKKAIVEWLQKNEGSPLPNAIICANDAIAIGCMETLAQFGFRVPKDVSICGFDDSIAARTTVPQLSTIRQPLREMGSQSVDILLQCINGLEEQNIIREVAKKSSLCFETELIHRASVSKPRKDEIIIPPLDCLI